MKLITRQSLANQAAERWLRQYTYRDGDVEPGRKDVYERLLALGETPEPNSVDSVIGNNSWTKPNDCSECGMNFDVVVELGEEPGYESSTVWLCFDCLLRAVELKATTTTERLALAVLREPAPEEKP